MNTIKFVTFEKEYAQTLLGIANGDLESAKALFDADRGRPENVCYHAEQAIEKALKAVLCHLGKAVPLTHDLGLLLGRFDDPTIVPNSASLTEFTQYATVRRYEEGAVKLDRSNLSASIVIADKLLQWAAGTINAV